MNAAIAELEEKAYQRAPLHQAAPRNAKFVVAWKFDGTDTATVTINRRAGTIEVRPYRRHRSYTLPLSDVAELIAERIAKSDAAVKRRASR